MTSAPPSSIQAPLPVPQTSAFRRVPKTGVIYVTTEAQKRGFQQPGGESGRRWCNLGQGQPETGALEGAPPRVEGVSVHLDDQEYAPVAGLWELRDAVASLYNQLYRRGLPSQYSAENVAISGGGRAALTRAAAALGSIHLGHFLPDYTAYEELLDVFRAFTPIPILLEGERAYAFSVEELRKEITGRGLGGLLVSNPSNPTGKHIRGNELARWVEAARDLDCAMLFDEFYSHYVYGMPASQGAPMESAARYVEDVNRDPVVLFDGLTKNWRYPGWRVTWTIGPKDVIESVASAGSFLDGGGSRPLQRAAIPLLDPAHVQAETLAIQQRFARKRATLLEGLLGLGVQVDLEPRGTFYVWGSVAGLPEGMNDGLSFFQRALEENVIVVPGEFFDVNPGKRRHQFAAGATRQSRFKDYVRFSFGPEEEVLREALGRLRTMVA